MTTAQHATQYLRDAEEIAMLNGVGIARALAALDPKMPCRAYGLAKRVMAKHRRPAEAIAEIETMEKSDDNQD